MPYQIQCTEPGCEFITWRHATTEQCEREYTVHISALHPERLAAVREVLIHRGLPAPVRADEADADA